MIALPGCRRESSATADGDAQPLAAPKIAVSPTAPAPANLSTNIAAGTVIPIAFTYMLDSAVTGRDQLMYSNTDEDVKGIDGRVAIPAGSTVTMIVRESSKKGPISRVEVGLYGVNIGGRVFSLSNGGTDSASLTFTADAGQGPAYTSVHIERGTRMLFKLNRAVELR